MQLTLSRASPEVTLPLHARSSHGFHDVSVHRFPQAAHLQPNRKSKRHFPQTMKRIHPIHQEDFPSHPSSMKPRQAAILVKCILLLLATLLCGLSSVIPWSLNIFISLMLIYQILMQNHHPVRGIQTAMQSSSAGKITAEERGFACWDHCFFIKRSWEMLSWKFTVWMSGFEQI